MLLNKNISLFLQLNCINMIAQNYPEWKKCIEIDCNIKLTSEFCNKRIKIYSDIQNIERLKFIELYGDEHIENIINWFKKALNECEDSI